MATPAFCFGNVVNVMRRERWTESQVAALPSGEQEKFDRKSGALVVDTVEFRKVMAKALSAFANSHGGHLILGVQNDGTVDGVPKVIKGRQPTREWLEQVIPNLLEFPLQDFEVHEVEADAPSVIPPDRVVIVIDVGDSMLAPHQDIFTKHYYHRVGSHSVPAPHHYLELLRGREKYPSQKIAHTWLNFVIPPMLSRLVAQRDHLSSDKLTSQPYYRGKPLAQVDYINTPPDAFSVNQAQFLNSYSETREAIEEHDRAVTHFRGAVERLTTELESSGILAERYSRAVSTESLLSIRESFRSELQADYGDTDESMRRRLLGSMSRSECLNLLANLIVNDEDNLRTNHCFWPLWNARKSEFEQILTISPISDLKDAVDAAKARLLGDVEGLISRLEQTRRELALKHGEPYVDETLSDSYHQPGGSFLT